MRTVPRPTSRRLTVLTLAILASAAPAAVAAPVSRTASGHAASKAIPAGSKIRTATSTVDPDTGRWVTQVTFDAPQSATSATALGVSLSSLDPGAPTTRWVTDTDPDRLGQPPADPDFFSPQYDGSPPPAGALSFNADRTVLTLAITDPKLVGVTPDRVQVSTGRRNGDGTFSTADLFFGATAPKPTLAGSGTRLVVARSGLITIPIRPLSSPAAQRVTVSLPGAFGVGVKYLPARYYRRTSVTFRVRSRTVKTFARSAVLSRTTWLENGSTASVRKAVTIRRR